MTISDSPVTPGDATEAKIREAFQSVKGVSLNTWHPITVVINGKARAMFAMQASVNKRGNSPSPIHLWTLKAGRLLQGMPLEAICNYAKLNSKNQLLMQGMPKHATEEQKRAWADAGFEIPGLAASATNS